MMMRSLNRIDMRGFGQSSAPHETEEYGGKNVTNDFAELLSTSFLAVAVFSGY
jgi:hypothetical protein